MSEQIRVHNPNGAVVVIDLAGHSLGGHEAGMVTPDRRTYAHLASGRLLERPGVQRAEPAAESEPVPASKKRNRTTTADNGAESGE